MSLIDKVRSKMAERSQHTYARSTHVYMGETEYGEFTKEADQLCLYGLANTEPACYGGSTLFGLTVVEVKQLTYLEVA